MNVALFVSNFQERKKACSVYPCSEKQITSIFDTQGYWTNKNIICR